MARERRFLAARGEQLREASRIIKHQLERLDPSTIWIRSLVRSNLGGDVGLFVQDIRHFESTSQRRNKTWPNPRNREETRRSKNTMGYQPQSRAEQTIYDDDSEDFSSREGSNGIRE